jgi:hypothetical protein
VSTKFVQIKALGFKLAPLRGPIYRWATSGPWWPSCFFWGAKVYECYTEISFITESDISRLQCVWYLSPHCSRYCLAYVCFKMCSTIDHSLGDIMLIFPWSSWAESAIKFKGLTIIMVIIYENLPFCIMSL